MHPYLPASPPVGFAHRGGAGVYPENTMRAFQHAVDLGFRYLETDVHLTRDGVLVAFHDSELDRVTDRTGRIEDLTWDEVAEARVAGVDPVPRFEELVAAFPDVRINIDPKANRSVEALATAIRDLSLQERVCVTAFSRRRTRRVKALVGPALCTGGGALATLAVMFGLGRRMFARDVDVLQVPPRVGPIPVVGRRFVTTAHRWGLQVHVWTIDEPEEMERLLDLGVDGIMTDQPAVLLEVFAGRGLSVG
ncbi:MAG: glycerophosphodiester phosphodiesterase [Actinomycetota bacterium]